MATIDEAEIERQFLNEQRGGSTEGGVARGDSAWLLSQTSTVTDSRSEDVHLFKKTHMNEKLSPELLPYEELVVTNLKRFLEAQKQTIEDYQETVEESFVAGLYQLEVDRVAYLLSDYHRIRLLKIQKFVIDILNTPVMKARLSKPEEVFAAGYFKVLIAHYKRSFTNQIPVPYRTYKKQDNEPNMVRKPNLERFVFCRVDQDIGYIQVEESDEFAQGLEAAKGDLLALRYKNIAEHLCNTKATLA